MHANAAFSIFMMKNVRKNHSAETHQKPTPYSYYIYNMLFIIDNTCVRPTPPKKSANLLSTTTLVDLAPRDRRCWNERLGAQGN